MKLTDVEFILLHILDEREEACGYEINRWIREQDCPEWTGAGSTAVYLGLNKLRKKRLVHSSIDTAKQGQGPLPRKFTINGEGRRVLQQEILAALSTVRDRDSRFDLAVAALGSVTATEAATALAKRKHLLAAKAEDVKALFVARGGKRLPPHLHPLFRHSLSHMKSETAFINMLLQALGPCNEL